MTEMHGEHDLDDETTAVDPDAVEPTGHARIDEALERLADIDQLEITSHPEEFDAIHQVLRQSLAHAGRDEDLPDSP